MNMGKKCLNGILIVVASLSAGALVMIIFGGLIKMTNSTLGIGPFSETVIGIIFFISLAAFIVSVVALSRINNPRKILDYFENFTSPFR